MTSQEAVRGEAQHDGVRLVVRVGGEERRAQVAVQPDEVDARQALRNLD